MSSTSLQPADSTTSVTPGERTVTRPVTRGRVLQWLRTTHLWLGLWGAVLGMLFGLSGLLMNHRAVLKIPLKRAEVSEAHLVRPQAFADIEEFSTWLAEYAGMPNARSNTRKEAAATVQWRGQSVEQPERWSVSRNTSKLSVTAKHIPGSGIIEIETQDATALGVLLRLHTGNGASVAWILLVDTIAGALMILTLSGVLMWSKLRTPRLVGIAVLFALPCMTVLYLAAV